MTSVPCAAEINSPFLVTKNHDRAVARPPNTIDTEAIKISTTPQVQDYLRQLLQTGLYGKTVSEAAHLVLTRSLDDMVAAGRLRVPPARNRRRRSRK